MNEDLILKIIKKYLGQKNNPLTGLTFAEIEKLAEKEFGK